VLFSSSVGFRQMVEQKMEKNIMDASTTFLFEVVFRDVPVLGKATGSASDQSIIVEVESDSIAQRAKHLPLEEGDFAREEAKELAPQIAIQVVQKDLPHGFEPAYSVMEIDQLPRDLLLRPPKFQGNRFRAWLLDQNGVSARKPGIEGTPTS
jgi:hypothetical protein